MHTRSATTILDDIGFAEGSIPEGTYPMLMDGKLDCGHCGSLNLIVPTGSQAKGHIFVNNEIRQQRKQEYDPGDRRRDLESRRILAARAM